MRAEEEIPESVKGTLDAMHGKEEPPGLQQRIALLTAIALVSGWATLQLCIRFVHRDAVSATHYVILFPCGWGFGVFIIALILFRKKRKAPNQTQGQPTGGSS